MGFPKEAKIGAESINIRGSGAQTTVIRVLAETASGHFNKDHLSGPRLSLALLEGHGRVNWRPLNCVHVLGLAWKNLANVSK